MICFSIRIRFLLVQLDKYSEWCFLEVSQCDFFQGQTCFKTPSARESSCSDKFDFLCEEKLEGDLMNSDMFTKDKEEMSFSSEDVTITRERSKEQWCWWQEAGRKIVITTTHGHRDTLISNHTHTHTPNVHYLLSPLELANSRTFKAVYITWDDYLEIHLHAEWLFIRMHVHCCQMAVCLCIQILTLQTHCSDVLFTTNQDLSSF